MTLVRSIRRPMRQGMRSAFRGLPNPLCFMPLRDNLDLLAGTGVATFTRSTTSTLEDRNTGLVAIGAIDSPRFETKGLLIEGSSTNEALHNRDYTNPAYIKTGITALKDAIGADGIINSASTLTATAPNGTVFQTITKASVQNTYSVDVRRKTGTGSIEISDDGGSTFTDITATVNGLAYTRFQITNTVLNPSIGFKLGTSGDEIEVDFNGLEQLPFASSRIITTTTSVTRTADNLSIDAANIPLPTADYSVSATVDVLGRNTETDQEVFNVEGEAARNLRAFVGAVPRARHSANVDGTGMVANVTEKLTMTKDSSALILYQDGVSQGSIAPGAVTGTKTGISIGKIGSANYLFGHIEAFRIDSATLTPTQVAGLS